ncbi:HET domain protein [Penicillium coprophilum]|uniref:HET domain protein n=1 Tax=Penicillium coprophilum TaxID=36646 RepID=UPI00238B8F91|nr:HET domain protein [Penicillium coprophilum]KAJ5170297.1 HET domain protein [Penicillium coprophilum]
MKSSYAKLTSGRFKPDGWKKLKNYCDFARENGWEWAWMDTCCIDKTDAVNTQEAINAMFRWYKESMICYAYLDDVDVRKTKSLETSFTHAKWFTRGWTLQELIAPTSLLFVDKNWVEIIDKINGQEQIERATGIQPEKLRTFEKCSIWERFSWASRRRTTLVEDRAYSLLGLFGINMPLIYGEGERAFLRLQHELIKTHDDASILLWGAHNYNEENIIPRRLGVLAPSVSCFQIQSGNHTISERLPGRNLSISAKGLHVDVDLMILKSDRRGKSQADNTSCWNSASTGFTTLGRQSIVIKEGFDLPIQASFLRLSPPPTGFKVLAKSCGMIGSRSSNYDPELSFKAFRFRISDAHSIFRCDVPGAQKGEYFITSGTTALLHRNFDPGRDSQWRVQMQYGANETFEVLLGTSLLNPDALLLAPGQLPSRQICLEGSSGTVSLKIRPRAAVAGRYVHVKHVDAFLDSMDPKIRLKTKLLAEGFSVGPISPREYDVILEHVPKEDRSKKRKRKK